MTVTMEHLIKYLNRRMAPKSYGSVLIHFRNGEITGITEKNDFNPDSFIDTVTKPVSRVGIKSYKLKKVGKKGDKTTELSEIDHNVTETAQTVTENDRETTDDH